MRWSEATFRQMRNTYDDGISDGDEYYGTGPNLRWFGVKTDPLDPDSDTDGLPDGLELGVTQRIPWAYDPNVPGCKIKGTGPEDADSWDDWDFDHQPTFIWYRNDNDDKTRPCFITDQDSSTISNPKEYDTNHNGIGDGYEDTIPNGIKSHYGWISYGEFYSYDSDNNIILSYNEQDELSTPKFTGCIAYMSDHLGELEFQSYPPSSMIVSYFYISSEIIALNIESIDTNESNGLSIQVINKNKAKTKNNDSVEDEKECKPYDHRRMPDYSQIKGKIYIISDKYSQSYFRVEEIEGSKAKKLTFWEICYNGIMLFNDTVNHATVISQAHRNIRTWFYYPPIVETLLLELEEADKVADLLVDPSVIGFITLGHDDQGEFATRPSYLGNAFISAKDLRDAMHRKNITNKKWLFIININCDIAKYDDPTKNNDHFCDLVQANGFYWGYTNRINLSYIWLHLPNTLWYYWNQFWLYEYPFIKQVYKCTGIYGCGGCVRN